jgi:hypothetical protein
MSSISSAHDPRAALVSLLRARGGAFCAYIGRLGSLPGTSSLASSWALQAVTSAMLFSNLLLHGAGQKRRLRATPAFSAPGEGCVPMIAVLVGNAQCISARCLCVNRERSSALGRFGGGCGVESKRGQGPPVFGKCARDLSLFVGWPA